MLGRAATAEFNVPGEHRRSLICIEYRCRCVSKPGEHVDAAGVGDQHQRVVAERQVMVTIVEDVERDLRRRLGIDVHVPIAGDRLEGNRSAATVERAARKRAMVRLCGRGLRRTR